MGRVSQQFRPLQPGVQEGRLGRHHVHEHRQAARLQHLTGFAPASADGLLRITCDTQIAAYGRAGATTASLVQSMSRL